MSFGGETGGNNNDRAREAMKIVKLLEDVEFKRQEDANFIEGISERLKRFGEQTMVSPRQLFYLRDLKDRSL